MSKSILLIASNGDLHALTSFMKKIGLHLVPMLINENGNNDVGEPKDGPACYATFVPIDELHTYGKSKNKIADVIDPMLFFMRPYYDPPYLTDVSIVLNEDATQVSEKIKPHFNKISRWLRKNWSKTKKHASWIGPEALTLIESGKAEWRSCLHAAQGEIIKI